MIAAGGLLVAVVLVPVLFLLVISFWKYGTYGMTPAFTLHNYRRLVEDDTYFSLLAQGTSVALAAAAAATLLGWASAYAILRLPGRARNSLLILLAAPFLIGEVLRIVGLRGLLDPASALAATVKSWGHGYPAWLMFSDQATALGIIQAWVTVPVILGYVSLGATLGRFDGIAASLGASPGQIVGRILLPLNLPAIAVSFMVVLIAGLTSALPADALGGPRGANLPVALSTVLEETSNWPFGAVICLLLLIVSASFSYAMLWLAARRR